jgi:phosphoenolpyruvate carboxylase
MIGYSDSNKDGGFVSANWALYQAQEMIAQACHDHQVKLTFFHGRGGTAARGGGPANRAIRAQPPGTIGGRFRVTEQGETIANRYTDPDIAYRHLEQTVSAVLLASAPDSVQSPTTPAAWRANMAAMSTAARAEYRNLVYESPRFIEFWRAATPIDEISRLHIGSRPTARRTGGLQVTHIRAIPWVFSWMQSRAIIPSWYGVGYAIAAFCAAYPDGLTRLQTMYHEWPFFNALIENAQLDLAKADMGIAELYAALVADAALREQIFGELKAEYLRACQMVCQVLGQPDLLSNAPVMQRSIERRNPYVDPLNFIQVELLRKLRALDPEASDYKPLLRAVLSTVNGVAAGMKVTG